MMAFIALSIFGSYVAVFLIGYVLGRGAERERTKTVIDPNADLCTRDGVCLVDHTPCNGFPRIIPYGD